MGTLLARPESFKDLAERGREALVEGGVQFSPGRFPMTYHHDHVRARLRLDAPDASRNDVARVLGRWASDNGADDADVEASYFWEAAAGAVAYLKEQYPEMTTPPYLANGIASHQARKRERGVAAFDEVFLKQYRAEQSEGNTVLSLRPT